jgi:RNA polymerase sigma-70 factor (ECF subfamily)
MLQLNDAIKGCLKNDNKSKEMVYKSFYGYIIGVVLRYVNNRDDAEELANDTFIKIFKNISQFSFPSESTELQKAFKGWVARISSRTAIDFLRSKKTFTSIDDIAEGDQPITQLNAITQLNVQDILRLLNALPETQRLIFNMYEIEGFSHDEISRTLNISESSSRVYLTRAKTKLRDLYAKNLIHAYATN